MGAGSDVKQLLLQVDASVELAKRNLNDLARTVQSDASKMDASLAKVDGAVGRLEGSFGKFSGAVGGLLAGIGVGAIVNVGRDILQFADDLDAAATKAGTSVERYQTLNEAFRALEISTEQTDKILKTFQATLGDVQNHADNSATKALDRLGISADILAGKIKTPDQLLDALAASATKAGSQAQFTSDVVDILGKKLGVDFAAAVADGGAALHQLEAQMIANGTVIDQQMIEKLADANEEIDAFTTQTKRRLTIWFAEAIDGWSRVGGAISGALDWLRRYQALAAGVAPFVPGGMAALSERSFHDQFSSADNAGKIALARSQVESIRSKRDSVPKYLGGRFNAITGQYEQSFNAVTGKMQAPQINPAWQQLDKTFQRGLAAANKITRSAVEAQVRVKIPGVDDGGGGGGYIPRPAPSRKSGGGSRRRSARSSGKPSLSDAELRDKAALEGGLLSPQSFIDFTQPVADLDRINESVETLRGYLGDIQIPDVGSMLPTEDQQRLEQFASDFNHELSSGLAEAIVYGDNLGDVLVNTFKRAAAAMISSGILNFLTAGKEGTSFGTMFANIGKVFGSFGGKRAAGGPVGAGMAYLVGEKGPEIFQPRVPGTIIPNHAMGGGGSSVSLTVHAPGATAETVMMIRREMANAAPALIAAARSATRRDLGRRTL